MVSLDNYLEQSRPYILGLVTGRVNQADMEDLAQDISIKVWKYQMRCPQEFSALVNCGEDEFWLRTVAGNVVTDYHRKPVHSREISIEEFPLLISKEISPDELVWERELWDIYQEWWEGQKERKPALTENAEAIRRTRDKQAFKKLLGSLTTNA